ncbi:hypothetical protein M8445_05335 [Deinococcus aquaticus]|uniref:Tetratricopeptide repeat protein n=1 Tax=Deinococcus aquaticus TaxID=328692 RepID=A0ABY7V4W7_9DEIO|nr:hypothetical protein [Deinococcus aquaticus]WDA59634.1 hypothetical protein M8445_05335 [Deinococcus aquaticus]
MNVRRGGVRRGRRSALLVGLLTAGLTGTAQGTAVLEDRTLRSENGAQLLWSRSYPDALGSLSGPLEVGETVYLGVGPVVFAYSSATGTPLGRADLPGLVTSLDASGGVVRVTTQLSGVNERFTLSGETGTLSVQERVVFPPDATVTGWLARAADSVLPADVQAAAAQDPLNPFLALRQAQASPGDPYAALSAVRRALNVSVPFPAWVQLAARLDGAGFPSAADLALDRARRDAAARGVDPDIPISRSALGAFGNPSGYVGTLLEQNRLARADIWMTYLRELHPRFQGGPALYARYAQILEQQGREGEAEEWRQFTRSLRGGTLYNLGPEGLNSVRGAARLTAAALLLTLLAALLTVAARAWPAQREDTRALGGRYRSWLRHPLSRARRVFVAYASPGERLLLTLLGAALVGAVGGVQWASQVSVQLQSPALSSGTYGGGWWNAQLANLTLRPGPDAALLSGLAAQLDGDNSLARTLYTQALPDACARNNLGVIAQVRGDEPQARELYRAALSDNPDLSAAAFNLGLNPGLASLEFQRTNRPGEPRLCYPDQRSVTRAVTGDLSVTLRAALSDPAGLLGNPAVGTRVSAALLASAALTALLALALLLPRTVTPLRRSRPPGFRLLALALPGAGVLDSPWGGMLLLSWGSVMAALAPATGLVFFPNLPFLEQAGSQAALLSALILTYVLNTLTFVTAEVRHARRVRRDDPDAEPQATP